MKEHKINFILIQIDEAHSTAWPNGLKELVEPQKDFADRVKRANDFIETDNVPFKVLIDTWENDYANKYKTWPDKYYCLDKDLKIVAKSEYGKKKDALINVECYELIQQLIEQLN
jgi:hypothetical protein